MIRWHSRIINNWSPRTESRRNPSNASFVTPWSPRLFANRSGTTARPNRFYLTLDASRSSWSSTRKTKSFRFMSWSAKYCKRNQKCRRNSSGRYTAAWNTWRWSASSAMSWITSPANTRSSGRVHLSASPCRVVPPIRGDHRGRAEHLLRIKTCSDHRRDGPCFHRRHWECRDFVEEAEKLQRPDGRTLQRAHAPWKEMKVIVRLSNIMTNTKYTW